MSISDADIPDAARILIFSAHLEDKFTGGRYHSWFLTQALAELGHQVTVVTDQMPLVRKEFDSYKSSGSIDVVISAEFEPPENIEPDVVILVPDLFYHGKVFCGAFRVAIRFRLSVLLFEFEAPNWVRESSSSFPVLGRFWLYVTGLFACTVVSMTATGSGYARRFFPLVGHFAVCKCCINSPLLPPLSPIPLGMSRAEVVVIIREDRGSAHKGADKILSVLHGLPALGTLNLIGGVSAESMQVLTKEARNRGITIREHRKISDLEKFQVISRSTCMVFLSEFEGFGLPPVEALCCGTRVLTFALPVLEENLKEYGADFIAITSGEDLTRKVQCFIAESTEHPLDLDSIKLARDRYSFERLTGDMDNIVKTHYQHTARSFQSQVFRGLAYILLRMISNALSLVGSSLRNKNV